MPESAPASPAAELDPGGDDGSAPDPIEVPEIDSLGEALDYLIGRFVDWFHQLVGLLPNLVVAVVLMLLALGLSAIVARVVRELVRRTSGNQTVANLVAAIAKAAVVFGGLFVALGVMQLDRTVTSLLAGAGIIGLALGFAFQDMAANLLAGVVMAVRKPFAPGDLIETHGYFGHVEKMNLRNTIMVDFDGQRVLIPNKLVFEHPLENYSQTGGRRIVIDVGLHYDTDLERAEGVLRDAIEAFDWRHPDKPVDVWFLGFDDSAIRCSVRYWITFPPGAMDYFAATHRGVKAIRKACAEAGITIPFPIRTVHLADRSAVPDQGAPD